MEIQDSQKTPTKICNKCQIEKDSNQFYSYEYRDMKVCKICHNKNRVKGLWNKKKLSKDKIEDIQNRINNKEMMTQIARDLKINVHHLYYLRRKNVLV